MTDLSSQQARRGGIPRGLSPTAPVIFSYGFRPFFLSAALWAVAAMFLWIASLGGVIEVASAYGTVHWHAHEMLFGYASAVLAGFLLTAVPNWTGRLPVSGWPLVFLFLVWVVGRLGFLLADTVGVMAAILADGAFLPLLLFICVREVVAGKKWKDLKVIGGLLALSTANILFHLDAAAGQHPSVGIKLALSAYVSMILVVGGRIIPSFTRNWINKTGRTDFPVAYNHFDTAAILCGVTALASWVVLGDGPVVAAAAGLAAVMHAARLGRWRGWTTTAEMLVAILHIAYLFVPLGFAAIAIAALGLFDETSAIHVLSVGTVATMMLAVMTRASRGHTGRVLTASRTTIASYGAIVLSALLRPSAAFFPEHLSTVYALAGLAWLISFGLFVLEYAPMLARVRRKPL
ncbi:NnrS family protein [Neorhizobium petrolearium]|uniref:NnrS family protein n=1 Tax=Neorhizobium petrolearium TaxID=515361 RepID=A0ABY8MBA6_9HYPH|nr:NnrS family protein [Neorhizobium petrolearium]MCC2610593.1 NnrS family protein [Neorhizobium petrolearium]WGI70730.1 NnrS family protein [Neorhizobium petrolearium]